MTDDQDEAELYHNALAAIEQAKRDREQQFPKIEALRQQWKEEMDELDGGRDALWIKCLIDCYTREIQALLDPDQDDPVDDPGEWLEFGYSQDEPRSQTGEVEGET